MRAMRKEPSEMVSLQPLHEERLDFAYSALNGVLIPVGRAVSLLFASAAHSRWPQTRGSCSIK
jgi:hypothetical protein